MTAPFRLACLLSLCLLAACASPRRGEPVAGRVQLKPAEARGEKIFMRYCHKCHPGGESGLGPALNNKPLPGPMIKLQVRAGLGAMPSFPENLLPSSQLDDLVEYLKRLRKR